MKKILVIAGIAVAALGLTISGATKAMVDAGANSPGQPVLTVDATNATLQIPDPACRPDGCQWGLFVFKIHPDGTQTLDGNGSAGVGDIVVPLPLNYCGQVQIDYGVFSDDGTFHKTDGHKYEVSTCETPTTTTTIGCPPNDTPPPCSVPTSTTTASTTTVPSVTPTTQPVPSTSVPPSVTPVAPAPAQTPAPNQLPDIAPAVDGTTEGNG